MGGHKRSWRRAPTHPTTHSFLRSIILVVFLYAMVLIVLQTTSPSHEHAGLIVGGPGAWRELPAGEAAPVLKEPALTDLGPRLKKPAAAVAKTPPEDVEEKEPPRPPPPPPAAASQQQTYRKTAVVVTPQPAPPTKIAATTRRTHSSSSADPRGTVAYAITVTKDGPYVDVRSRKKACNSSTMIILTRIALLCREYSAHYLSSSHGIIFTAPNAHICSREL